MLEIKIERALPGFNLKVDLVVQKEILSILGPSGCGKTMTLLCIAGLIKPDRGFVKLDGRTLFNSDSNTFMPTRDRNIGFVFQNYALFPHLTVAENIAYGLHGLSASKIADKVSELLELIHIPALKDRYPAELSSGQQQRVALARAIAPEPAALLLDEPFSALDTYRKERLEYELLALKQYYRGPILFVTHDLEQGYKMSERMAIFDHGRIIQCAKKHEVVKNPVNHTAARLTGFKNLIRGKVVSIDNSYLQIFIPEFKKALQATLPENTNYAINQPVVLGIKPEDLALKDQPDFNCIDCIFDSLVESVSDLNYFYLARSDSDKRYSLEIRAAKTKSFLPDTDTGNSFIYFDPNKFIVLPDYAF